MKKYEYVGVSYKTKDLVFVGIGADHRAIIDEYAAKGYRFVGSIVTEMDNNARIRAIDLVFERDA